MLATMFFAMLATLADATWLCAACVLLRFASLVASKICMQLMLPHLMPLKSRLLWIDLCGTYLCHVMLLQIASLLQILPWQSIEFPKDPGINLHHQ